MVEKRVPRYPLATIKRAFAVPEGLNRTLSAAEGAEILGFDEAEVIAVIQSLTKADFEKSMTSFTSAKVWQDVYKPFVGDKQLYIKFTLNAQQDLLLISFKEA